MRKKLLESFYGASAAVDEGSNAAGGAGTLPDPSTAVPDNKKNDDDGKLKDGYMDQDEGDNGGEHNTSSSPSSDIPTSITHPSSSALFRSPSQIPLPFTATKLDLDSPNFGS